MPGSALCASAAGQQGQGVYVPLACSMADDEEWEVRCRASRFVVSRGARMLGGVAESANAVSQENLEAIDALEASGLELDEISWEEVMQHNKVDDMWVSIVRRIFPPSVCARPH
eukprot:COSAG03_NODE_8229_length_823_cov_1.488950_3_plen_113_part_01